MAYALVRVCAVVSFCIAASLPSSLTAASDYIIPANLHPLSLEDVLGLEHIDQIVPAPDGDWIAVSVQRGAIAGEIYGRTAYETDPSRNDIWLISQRTQARRNLTSGQAVAAGFWCASWSPNGHRLAFLSTFPEGTEPRGGDNVRLYLWDRDSNQLKRLGNQALITQTRYGGAIHRLNLQDGSGHPQPCGGGGENAPYLWLDNDHLLAVTLRPGQVSGLLDEAGRPFEIEARDARRLHDGDLSTAEAVGSGSARTRAPDTDDAILATVDTTAGHWNELAQIPSYPFRGDLSLAVSPNGKRLAILATMAAFPPATDRRFPHADDGDWTVEKQFGIVDLRPNTPLRWVLMPANTPYPLEMFAWSPDSRRLALRARSSPSDASPSLIVVDADRNHATRLTAGVMDQEAAGSVYPHDTPVVWEDARHLLAALRMKPGERLDWWRLDLDAAKTNLTANWKELPSCIRRLQDGRLAAVTGSKVVMIDSRDGGMTTNVELKTGGGAFLPVGSAKGAAADPLVETTDADGKQVIHALALGPHAAREVTLPAEATNVISLPGGVLWQKADETGSFLMQSAFGGTVATRLLSLNSSLTKVRWGQTRLFGYRTSDGTPVTGAVILPPDYRSSRTYPTLVWVYPGYQVQKVDDYWLDPQLPGLYNLQLYAARGYAILIPTMPLPADEQRQDVFATVTHGVLPAMDRLVALGIADPLRFGVFGQSYGGYAVTALLTQTNRFKAGVALAGITDLVALYGQFDPLAQGYPGIAHEKSANWNIAGQFGLQSAPFRESEAYTRNSPLSHVEQVQAPLLLIHGSLDERGSLAQAEEFFYGLYAQGKTTRLVRYAGESHSLAQSPANIRDIFSETLSWFDRYTKP